MASCAGCHAAIAATYRKTGMGRAFTVFDPARTTADFTRNNRFRHAASQRTYAMTLRDGEAWMRRHQTGPDGRETNVVERRIDYIMGSGLKAQTLIHRTPRGELVEMPVAWYTSSGGRGGYWAMNPSYDRADHPDFRRRIRYDCFFCHDGYPQGIADDSFFADPVYPPQLPSGIDCQRCHGPGAAHVEAAVAKAPVARIRAGIVNPGRLPREARLDVCYQCHLQSTSSPLPHFLTRAGRGVFSFRAGEPLAGYGLFFDHPAGAGYDDKFEIAHAAYRMRQSRCFAQSDMTCITCHDPHKPEPAGSRSCRQCHPQVAGAQHARAAECISCHMPQRRTQDVVQVVMTDHRIVRRPPPGNLTAPLPEHHGPLYRGPVAPMHPPAPDALQLAIAQVRTGTNLAQGLPQLERAVAAAGKDCPADCYYDLADAFARSNQPARAAQAAEEALRRAPDNPWILRAYGSLLSAQGDLTRGAELLSRARAKIPNDPGTLHALAMNAYRQGRAGEAVPLLREAVRWDPDLPEAHLALGEILQGQGDAAAARAAFEDALRARPDDAQAHLRIAALDPAAPGAGDHFRQAARFAPDDARVRHAYGVWLAAQQRYAEALPQLEAAAKLDPAALHTRLALGMVLAARGEAARANPHLEAAAASADAAVREQAAAVLASLRGRR